MLNISLSHNIFGVATASQSRSVSSALLEASATPNRLADWAFA
jgi:hypothetical protein